MRSIQRKPSVFYGLIAAVCCFVALFFGVLISANYAQADTKLPKNGERLITIHDSGRDRGILTKAATLRQAFKEAGVRIDESDLVEPGLDEKLVATNYEVNVYRARLVTIVDGPVQRSVVSPYRTAKQIVQQAGMTLRDEDIAEMGAPTDMVAQGTGIRLTITRATEFTFVLYGKKTTAYTQAKTVGDMLKEKKITLGEKDRLSVAQEATITAGMKVELWRDGKQTVTRDEKIPFEVEKIEDADHEVGYRKIKTPGVKGEKTVTYEIVMKNGKEVSRKKIQSVTTKKPEKQVEIVGTKVEGPEQIIAKIRAAASAKGIDAQRVLLIAQCESGFNPRSDSGYYKGLFQQDPSYWPGRAAKYGYSGASYFDVDAQIGVATSMMAGGGWSHWGCDPGPQ